MSKLTHAIYLSVIGVLIFVIAWLAFADSNKPPGDPMSIAVLPFVALDSDESANRVADSVTDKIREALAQEPRFEVTARSATEQLIESELDIAAIGEALAVAGILEGSIRTSGNKIRVTAQLIDVVGGAHLWSSTYDRSIDDIDNIAADIATKAASFGYE